MRQASPKKTKANHSALTEITNSPAHRLVLVVALLLCSLLLAAAVRAYNHRTPNDVSLKEPSVVVRLPQGNSAPQLRRLNARLAVQPEADRLRRRLGQRFLAQGLEQSIMTGLLTIGSERNLLRVVRTQNDDGERVEIPLGGGTASLTWTASEGARLAGHAANQNEQLLIERLALDSPDQFVLAQLRGASYFTVARDVPAEANVTESYTGPIWDLIRVGEPEAAANKPQSPARLYYINTSTGLIDKVISQEQGNLLVAEISNWVRQSGELVPAHITWKRNDQVVMEWIVNDVAYGAR